MSSKCPHCGDQIEADDRFCSSCGAVLEKTAKVPWYKTPGAKALYVVVGGYLVFATLVVLLTPSDRKQAPPQPSTQAQPEQPVTASASRASSQSAAARPFAGFPKPGEHWDNPNYDPNWAKQETVSTEASLPSPDYIPVNQEFKLGEVTFRIGEPQFTEFIGNIYSVTPAPTGSIFVVVPVFIRNDGKKTITILADNFQLKTESDETYRTDSRAVTALSMTYLQKDWLLSELHPGVANDTMTAFVIPAKKQHAHLYLRVPEPGFFARGEALVKLR